MKILIILSFIFSFSLANITLTNEKIDNICSLESYQKRFNNSENCKKEFFKLQKKEINKIEVLKKAKNTKELFYLWESKNKLDISINVDKIYEQTKTLDKNLAIRFKKIIKYQYIYDNIWNLYLSKNYNGEDPFYIIKENKRQTIKSNKEIINYISNYNDFHIIDKLKFRRLITIINSSKTNHKELLNNYLNNYLKIKNEDFFNSKLLLKYIESFTFLTNKSDLKYIINYLNKIHENETNLVYKIALLNSIQNISKKIDKELILSKKELDSLSKKITIYNKNLTFMEEFIEPTEYLSVFHLFLINNHLTGISLN